MLGKEQSTEVGLRRGPVLLIVLLSYLMIVLDISIMITALPKIRDNLGFSATSLSWVQTAYTLAFGGLLLLGARAGDIWGRRRMFVLGLAVFTAASFAIGVAPAPGWLIAARAVQGVGAAVLAPSTLALLQAGFPEGRERTRAVAYYGAVAGVGASIGLVLGGVLTEVLSWRVGFFLNVPIGIAMIAVTPRFIRETTRRPGRLDGVGAVTSTLGMVALVYGIVHAADAGWANLVTVGCLAGGVVLLAALIINERRVAQPIMPLRLFASRERSAAYASRILFLGAMMGFWFFLTQFLQSVYGFSPLQAGLGFLPMTIANFAVALVVPQLTHRFGNGRLLAAGLGITLIGMAWLSRLSADSPYLLAVALPMILIGAGQGATLSPLTAAGIARVEPVDAGAASGLVNVAHQLGGSLGLGILVTVFAAAHPAGLDATHTLAHQIGVALTAGTVMLAIALGLVLALIVRRTRPGRRRHHARGRRRGGGPARLRSSGSTWNTRHCRIAAHAGWMESTIGYELRRTRYFVTYGRKGMSFSASSRDTGADVTGPKRGDLVVAPFVWADNTCDFCREGLQTSCRHGGMWARNGIDGGQGEAVRVPQAQGTLVKLPVAADSALLPSLLALSDVLPTGHHCAVTAGVNPRTTVTVIGDGAVGLSAVLAAGRLGAERIILMGRHKDRTDLGREFGATDVVAERGAEGVERVRELTGGDGTHAVLECVGLLPAIETAFGVVRNGGTVSRVGAPQYAQVPADFGVFFRNITLTGGVAPARAYIDELLPDVLEGRIKPGKVFDRTIGLDHVADGYRAMAGRQALKVLIQS